MGKRILYLSFYFEPDLCAGSFRNSPLARELAAQGKPRDVEVEVMTTLPNRYSTYTTDALEDEVFENLRIKRIRIPGHQSGVQDQMRSFRVYFEAVFRYTKGKEYDLVFASSSRLFTAYLGYRVAKQRNLPLYLDIRDIFVDTIKDVFANPVIKAGILPFMKHIEKRTFNYAAHINLISGGFKEYFKEYPKPRYSYFSNGIDPVFLNASKDSDSKTSGVKIILYAGNLGEGQGLHKIVPDAARLLGEGFKFRIIGDGGAKAKLIDEINSLRLNNVEILPPVNRASLIEEYNQADFLFMHLNDYEAFKKVLPSKVFELGVFPKPLIAGVNGFAREFVKINLSDALLIRPCNGGELAEKVLQYQMEQSHDRSEFIKSFKRDSINKKMADSILSYL